MNSLLIEFILDGWRVHPMSELGLDLVSIYMYKSIKDGCKRCISIEDASYDTFNDWSIQSFLLEKGCVEKPYILTLSEMKMILNFIERVERKRSEQ